MTRCTTCALLLKEPFRAFVKRVGGTKQAEAYHYAAAMDWQSRISPCVSIYCFGQEPEFVEQLGDELTMNNIDPHELFSKEHQCKFYQPSTGQISISEAIKQYQGLKQAMNINQTHIKVRATDSIVNINSTLTNATQSLQTALGISDSSRQEIIDLFEKLKIALNTVSPTDAEAAEVVADQAQVLSKELARQKPRSSMLKISSSGLIEATKTLAKAVPTAVKIAEQIAKIVMG